MSRMRRGLGGCFGYESWLKETRLLKTNSSVTVCCEIRPEPELAPSSVSYLEFEVSRRRDGDGILLGLAQGHRHASRHVVVWTHLHCCERMEAESDVLSVTETRHGMSSPQLGLSQCSNIVTANAPMESNYRPSPLPCSTCHQVSERCHPDSSHRRTF